jgi:hypothetical protein
MSANTSANTPCHPHPLRCVPRVELRLRFELLVVDRLLLVLFLLLLFLLARALAFSEILLLLLLLAHAPLDALLDERRQGQLLIRYVLGQKSHLFFPKLLQQQAPSQQLLLRKRSRQTSGGPCVHSALLGRGTAFPRRRRRRRALGFCCAPGLAAAAAPRGHPRLRAAAAAD